MQFVRHDDDLSADGESRTGSAKVRTDTKGASQDQKQEEGSLLSALASCVGCGDRLRKSQAQRKAGWPSTGTIVDSSDAAEPETASLDPTALPDDSFAASISATSRIPPEETRERLAKARQTRESREQQVNDKKERLERAREALAEKERHVEALRKQALQQRDTQSSTAVI